MKKQKPLRYQQAPHAKVDGVNGNPVALRPALRSFIGGSHQLQFFEKSFTKLKLAVHDYRSGAEWLAAYTLWANLPSGTSNRRFANCITNLRKGFLRYLFEQKETDLDFSSFDTAVVASYLKWEKSNCKGLGGNESPKTVAARYTTFKTLVLIIAKSANHGHLAAESLIFPTIAFKGLGNSSNPRGLDDDDLLINIYKSARADALETINCCKQDWKTLEDECSYAPVEQYRGMKRYPSLEHVIHAVDLHFRESPTVTLGEIRKADPGLWGSICYNKFNFWRATLSTRPSAKNILPFVLLYTIYFQANTGTLRSLKINNIKDIEVLGAARTQFHLLKNRATPYERSFSKDPNDNLSPDQIHQFLMRWTSQIRKFAGQYSDHLFIFYTKEGKFRAFNHAEEVGHDADILWTKALRAFCKKWSIPDFCLSDIRMTGLDVIREIHADDIRAVMAAGGQSTERVVREHYEGKQAKRRSDASLAEIVVSMPRFIQTGGRSDPRGMATDGDVLAATPGWGCHDPYSSPRHGQLTGRLCSAFGECPSCPLAVLDINSPYSVARVLQLREELEIAKDYLHFSRWKDVFSKVASDLDEKWLPSCSKKSVMAKAASLSLPAFGRLE